MESASSVEFVGQVRSDAGLGHHLTTNSCISTSSSSSTTTTKTTRHHRYQDQVLLTRSSSQHHLDQGGAADVLNNEDDFLDRLEDEDVIDDMTPEINNPHAHRRTSSPADCVANKKSNKPLMEKKRRQRINRCLSDLKTLVLEALKKDPSRYSKLEKADILEMTVRHLQMLHRHESAAGRMMGNGRIIGGDDLSNYRAGFSQCTAEVTKYLAGMNDIPHDLHSKVFTHLSSITTKVNANVNTNATCVQNSVNVMPNLAPIILVVNNAATAPTPISQISAQSINFHDTAGNSLGAQPNFTVLTAPRTQGIATPIQQQPQTGGLQILPTRLNNGDLALVLPAFVTQNKEVRAVPSAALQASAPVLTAILTSDRNQTSSSTTIVQPPALSTSSDDSALGPETLDISDSDMSSGISTPLSSMSTASSPLPAEEAGRMSPRRASTSRSFSPPKSHFLSSSCFREELGSTACSSQNPPRRHPVIAPKPSYPWPPHSSPVEHHKRKKVNTPPPPEADPQSVWRPWH